MRQSNTKWVLSGGVADFFGHLLASDRGSGIDQVEVDVSRAKMKTNRIEAFSDGVIAIIITIMVLELKVPHGDTIAVLLPLVPVLLSYVLSFVYPSEHLVVSDGMQSGTCNDHCPASVLDFICGLIEEVVEHDTGLRFNGMGLQINVGGQKPHGLFLFVFLVRLD